MQNTPTTPYRQIRALYDDNTITVYQAYFVDKATEAIKSQQLSASPKFSHTRMTWIKPSWCWMMYRAGYSFKDAGQARILALRMTHANFHTLLSHATVTHSQKGPLPPEARDKAVRVQWDPERSASLEVLPYRSIQIGVSGKLSRIWAEDWIDSIEDVTDRAQALKRVIDEEPDVGVEELKRRALMPEERVYDLPEDLRRVLKMDAQ